MTLVRVYEDEPFEIALKRFKRKCVRDGIFTEVRKRQFYEKLSVKKKRKRLKASQMRRRFKTRFL